MTARISLQPRRTLVIGGYFGEQAHVRMRCFRQLFGNGRTRSDHVFVQHVLKTWVPGTSPGMTIEAYRLPQSPRCGTGNFPTRNGRKLT